MPYKMQRKGGKFCVVNSDTGENKGCSTTRAKAAGHMRRLYQVEGESKKEALTDEVLDALVAEAIREFENEYPDDNENKEASFTEAGWMRPGATSFAELEMVMEEEDKAEEMRDLIAAYPTLANNILISMDIEDKPAALKALADELGARLQEVMGESEMEDKELCEECADEKARADVSEADKKRAVEEYGNVTYADPENKKYPVDTEAHIRAAWSYINMPKNAKKYSPAKAAAIKGKIVRAWKSKIDKAGPPSAKELNFIERVYSVVKQRLFPEEEVLETPEQGMLIWKEADVYRWVARYSNNFRDRDVVPEIISAESHRNFVEMVDKGLAPYPELWLWHVPEWKLGKANWVAYDDSGFALAGGTFSKGLEQVAEWLSTKDNVAVSHGMPPKTIVRDENDPTVIKRHQTVEISPLPSWAAANVLTGFIALNKEANMPIPSEKRENLILKWGMPAALVDQLEAANESTAKEAQDAGIESKEVEQPAAEAPAVEATETEAPPAVEEQPVAETPPVEEEVKEQKQFPTREEVAEAFANIILPITEKQNEQIAVLLKQVGELASRMESMEKSDTEKITSIAKETPMASLSALIQSSVIGNRSTFVKDGSSLADAKPKETEATSDAPRIGIPFIDQMITSSAGKQS